MLNLKNKMLSIIVQYIVPNMLWTIILVIVAIIIIVLFAKALGEYIFNPSGWI